MIRRATYEDLIGIAKVHKECFEDSFSTQLGEKLLVKFYSEYLQTNPTLFVIAEENDEIVGFCMGYCMGDRDFVKDFIKHNFILFFLKCVFLALTGNKQFYKKIRKSSGHDKMVVIDHTVHNTKDDMKADLLSICVTPAFRGSGVAQGLMQSYIQAVRGINKKILLLSVDPNNQRAIHFYTKNEFRLYRKAENFETYARTM